jgi:hypothetical protein
MDPIIQLAHEKLIEYGLHHCVVSQNGNVELHHNPKRGNRKILGIAADIPFLGTWPLSREHHNDEFDPAKDDTFRNDLLVWLKRWDVQRDFIEAIIARPALYKSCRGYHQ